ncbi:MAG: DUF4330 family protein [Clostridia bacterium]|nr:DUF4330 family protein [Clostridia bacterium]
MRNKLKKFNVLDIVIVVLIVAIIAGAFFRTDIIHLVSGEETVTMEIAFESEPMSTLFYSYFITGDNVYIAGTDTYLGKVDKLSKVLAPVMVQMEDGSFESDVELEKSVVSGVLTVQGYYRDGVFCLENGKTISAGDVISAEGTLIAFDLTVKSVTQAETSSKTEGNNISE